MRAMIISNPTSGGNETMLGEVIGTVESIYDEILIRKTLAQGDARRFAEASGSFEHLIVIGGDGTLHEVVNGLMAIPRDQRPTIGLIPAARAMISHVPLIYQSNRLKQRAYLK
ncbi:acylglycerol kinase family protein [Exiguobacterium sp. AM39-5BH]|uniref:acylglycerol kinase family protein n=1 Tax=Exiguobacterium sp. AM39-5BH TaxID=2292355 RepID=UPI001F489351|nr:acylglycerol kinase family protein [Exiguobacterium sp. AM39-5BH]